MVCKPAPYAPGFDPKTRYPARRSASSARHRAASSARRSAATRAASGLTDGRLVECSDGAHGGIEQVDQPGKRVAEKAGHAQRDIDARPVEHRGRQDLEPGHPAARPLPDRAHADQRQGLGNVVAAGAHVGGAPGRQCDARRVVSVFLGVALEEQRRRFPAELPGRLRRHGAGVDRIEIAPGRQYLRPAAARRAGRPGRNKTPVEPGKEAGDFGSAACRHRRA